jgi:uncharacterized membrane protein YfcA
VRADPFGCGIAGAFVGSSIGKSIPGENLLLLFALLMIGVAVAMLRGRGTPGNPAATCTIENAPKTVGFGVLTGLLSGFFGICGGLLIVPGLIAATGMPILMAIGSSLVAVTAFGTTTALNFALSGYVDWVLGAVFVTGGFAGMLVGARLSKTLSAHMGLLNTLFAGMIFLVALYMAYRSAMSLLVPG